MGKQIIVDADKLEHLLNCMAQLDFLPMTGRFADEEIIRKAYHEGREMLHNAAGVYDGDGCRVEM